MLAAQRSAATAAPGGELRKEVPALKCRQWLAAWSDLEWKPEEFRSRPPEFFYQFSLPAVHLRALSGVRRRTTDRASGAEDLGIQRRHDPRRSAEIRRFIESGYPWSTLSDRKRASGEYADLRQPGWLPTAVVVNILTPDARRYGQSVSDADLVRVEPEDDRAATVVLPSGFDGPNWTPGAAPPIEVIDGQHRLWAFEGEPPAGVFELPVIAFVGLDLSWQAYLFFTINIKPKRINPSLAFDLYPLLRTEDWLTRTDDYWFYREVRAQELVDLLWSCSGSPWRHRINMLGEFEGPRGAVSQAGWVRSLLVSLMKPGAGARTRIGGLFASDIAEGPAPLPWTRQEQAAFLIHAGNLLRDAIGDNTEPWAVALRGAAEEGPPDGDPAFLSPDNLLNQDQGVRAFLQVLNALCVLSVESLELDSWRSGHDSEASDDEAIRLSLATLLGTPLHGYLRELGTELSQYDWRASRAPGLTEDARLRKAAFRGSGGYRTLRDDLLRFLAGGTGRIAEDSRAAAVAMGVA